MGRQITAISRAHNIFWMFLFFTTALQKPNLYSTNQDAPCLDSLC